MRKNNISMLFSIFLALFTISGNLFSQDQSIEFTEEEINWISENKNLNVANEMDWPPFDFVKDGKPAGYSIDLIRLIAKKTGLHINLVNGYSWNELIDLFKNDEIQIMPAVYRDDERSSYMEFTTSYYTQPTVLITNSLSEINSISDLSNKNVAVIEGFSITSEIEENYPKINRIPVENVLDGLMKVSTGELDGFIESIGVVSYYTGENFIPNLKISSDVQLNKMDSPPLYMSVSKDNIILRDILQKGLNSISKEEMNAIKEVWIDEITFDQKEDFFESSDLWEAIIGVLILFIVFYIVFKWIFKKYIKEKVALEFGSRKFRIKTNFYLIILVLVVAFLGWFSVMYIKAEFTKNIKLQLENDLGSANGRLEFWLKERKDFLKSLGQNQKLVHLTNELLEVSENYNEEKLDIVNQKLSEFFNEYNYQDNFIINEEGINLKSYGNNNLGKLNNIVKNKREILRRVFEGEVVFVSPLLSISKNIEVKEEESSLMYFFIPIENVEHRVIAAIIKEIDPIYGFSEILQLSHVGETGESYIFNRNGKMLSKSRFEKNLLSLGVFQLNNYGTPYIEIKDPGGNLTSGFKPKVSREQQPLTYMAKSAIEGNKDVNVEGYNDYRGVPVMGAWMWIDELELGLTTEIDVDEALGLFYFIQLSTIVVLSITLILIIGSILFTLSLGEKANAALVTAKDELEERVIVRTTELNNEKSLLNSLINAIPDLIFYKDINFKFLGANTAFEKQIGFKKEDIIGKKDTSFMTEELALKFEKSDSEIIKNSESISMESEEVDSDGNIIIFDTKKTPFFNEQGKLLGLIGISRDITERKKAESRLKSQSAALKSAANGIVITNTKGEIVWVNPAFSKLTGYAWREVVGKNPRILNSGKHDINYFKNLWDTIQNREVWHDEVINKKKNGDLYYEEMTITPILDDKGKIIQFVAIKQDITERKKLEIALEKANERMSGELNVAKDIQMSMLPLIFPAFPQRDEIDIYASLIPAREVGGDFYDFHFLDENHIYFVVGDVSGKGVPAALMMAVTKTLLKSRAGNDKSTASILTHVNNEIAKENEACMFITVFVAILNTSSGELKYSNAGHNPSFLIGKNRNISKLSDLHGPVIGLIENIAYKETTLFIEKEDLVLVYTDGVTEAHNKKEELYSDARFLKLLEEAEYNSTKSLTDGIIESVKIFENEAEQFDDITVLSLQYLGHKNTTSTKMTSITIKNVLLEMTIVKEHFESFGMSNDIPRKEIQKIKTVLDELLNNIISYGFNDEKDHNIEVDIVLRNLRLIITIKDDGIPFNPLRKDPPDTMLSLDERNLGGLGIHIVKKLVDECDYKRQTNRNILTLVKYNIKNK